jgi:glycosyltransferase involved in cell wall biosynthesis
MRILMLCTKYPLDPADRYMTNELPSALVAAGHRVQVVVTQWAAPYGSATVSMRSQDGVDVLAIAPRAATGLGGFVEKASKWTLSSWFALREMRRALSGRAFDLLICFTPCVTVAAQLLWATRHFHTRNMLFVHDFFPYHHHEVGLIPGGPVFALAHWAEQRLIGKFHVIGCNWPGNIDYLRRNYHIRPQQQVIWTPLWGQIAAPPARPKASARAEHGLPPNGKIVVFGGQIVEGRGVEEMLAAADIARKARPEILFLFVGEGRLTPRIEQHIACGGDNVMLKRRIPRDEYLSLLDACDAGLVATVKHVDSSSFPTKTIDYLRASLPIVAAVEEDSDYRAFLDRWRIGVSTPAGDGPALYRALIGVLDDPQTKADFAQSARRCLEEVFDVRAAVARIAAAFDHTTCSKPTAG